MFRRMVPLVLLLACVTPLLWAEDAKEEKVVKLVHVESSKAIAPEDGTEEGGTKLVTVKDEAKDTQNWLVVKDGESLKIVHKSCKMVMDVEGASTDEGAAVIIWEEKTEDNDNQRWTWLGTGDERRLKSKASELVLSVNEEGQLTMAKLDEKDKKQLWKVTEVKK